MPSVPVSPAGPEFSSWDEHTLPELQHRTHSVEADTERLRGYEPGLITGQLQTREYATEVLRVCQNFSGRPTDASELEPAVAARMARQADWRTKPVQAHFLLAEQALYTTVGGPAVMVAQLEALLEILELPGAIEVGVIARTAPFVTPTTNFLFYNETRATVETLTGQVTVTDPQGLASYEAAFERLAAQAVTGEAVRDVITTALAYHRWAASCEE
ncbi:DUF5753 domain-containing protein [Nocardia carnea]|uniref:DUF5753 domain-containing protein n=1 Tax=Nocardia carnea TaxID=37328 RepID=UPI00245486AB|nr:DUF5753 domain-containing protein [Nocardia carnea]